MAVTEIAANYTTINFDTGGSPLVSPGIIFPQEKLGPDPPPAHFFCRWAP